MEQNQYVEYLLHFGLTRQEALIYVELLVKESRQDMRLQRRQGFPGPMCILFWQRWQKKERPM